MFSHYPCVTAVADGMGSSCLHFSSRHLAQDNFLLATLATVDVSLMQAQWWTKHLKMQAHSWSWCCNFCACILLGVFVHQCLFSLLPFFLYYLLKTKSPNSSKTIAHVILLNFWDINIIPKVPWIQFYSTAVMMLYFSPLVKLPFQEVMQFSHGIFICLLRQENLGKFFSFASEKC